MSAVASLLETVRIATPCHVSWDAMSGDERVRFCEHCKLHVYNLSALTRLEAEDFLRQHEGQTCLRLFRRSDGTVLTRDCQIYMQESRVGRRVLGGLLITPFVAIGALWGMEASKMRRGDNSDRWGSFRAHEPFRTVLNWLDPLLPPTPVNCTMGKPPPPQREAGL
jgi:hypothetical protein